MEQVNILNTMVAYTIIFYLATNIVPANADRFYIDTQNLKDPSQKMTLNFTKQKDGNWKVVPDVAPDDPLYFSFDKNLNFYSLEGRSGQRDTLPLSKLIKIKKNHKKWKKVTEVMIKPRSADSQERLSFVVEKKGKKQRIIRPGDDVKTEVKEIPSMHLRWE
ncbi:hypothetical protein BKI52_24235 [marine bacterium AO1-C]|nr:hypothetical protein BKI52_24235 [marine bacterium AO1-C]